MRQGGNAVDGAVAAAAAASVVQPFTSGIGGVGYATVYIAATKEVHIIDFSGRIPFKTSADLFTYAHGRVDFRSMEMGKKNLVGSLTPGVVAGWEALIKRHGELSFAEVLAPAIRLADKGFPVSFALHARMKRSKARLMQWPDAARTFSKTASRMQSGKRIEMNPLTIMVFDGNGKLFLMLRDPNRSPNAHERYRFWFEHPTGHRRPAVSQPAGRYYGLY